MASRQFVKKNSRMCFQLAIDESTFDRCLSCESRTMRGDALRRTTTTRCETRLRAVRIQRAIGRQTCPLLANRDSRCSSDCGVIDAFDWIQERVSESQRRAATSCGAVAWGACAACACASSFGASWWRYPTRFSLAPQGRRLIPLRLERAKV